MARWQYTVDVSGVWANRDRLPFHELRDAIVDIIRASAWYRDHRDDDLEDVLIGLAEAQTPEEFDRFWSDVYDLADEHRAWVETVGRRPR